MPWSSLLRSSSYHPQTDGQTERVNQVLEDMLRACVISFPEKWDECLKLAGFSYNNIYQESIQMHHLRLFMARNAGPHSTGLRWETVVILGLTLCWKQERRLGLSGVI
jgi:hypothetical protein